MDSLRQIPYVSDDRCMDMLMNYADLHETMLSLTLIAGYRALVAFQTGDFTQSRKSDNSIVTSADLEANRIITEGLNRKFPAIPVISEEGTNHTPPAGGTFFLVDPIDGTNGFASGQPEFTINIAYVEDNVPSMGVVYAPAVGSLCHNDAAGAVYGLRTPNLAELILNRTTPLTRVPANPDAARAIVSRSPQQGAIELAMLDGHAVAGHLKASSSLKFNMLVAGHADIYPRKMESNEWDTAAGHAILLASGGCVQTVDGTPLTCGKPGLRNPGFIALAHGMAPI